MDKPIKDWGQGIPNYTEDDVLKGVELHAFCTNVVAESMQDEGYTIEGVVLEHAPTQVIANKDGIRYAVIVAGGIFPQEGRVSLAMKKQFASFCQKQGIVPMFASVGLMSQDAQRAYARLALKYDGYRIRYTGAVDLSNIHETDEESADHEAYCVEKIIEAYSSGQFDILYDHFSEDIEFHSQWVMEPLLGKAAVIDYFDKKGRAIRGSDTRIGGSVVMINRDHKRTGNFVLMSEPGKLCALISQELRGNVNWIFISPKFDQDGKISKLSLNDPELFDFEPYYAFE